MSRPFHACSAVWLNKHRSAEPDHLTGDDGLGWYVISTLL